MTSVNQDPGVTNQPSTPTHGGELAADVLSKMEATSAGISYIGIVAAVFLVALLTFMWINSPSRTEV